jgi:Nucleotidyltransferase domain
VTGAAEVSAAGIQAEAEEAGASEVSVEEVPAAAVLQTTGSGSSRGEEHLDDKLNELVARLQARFSERLVSVILYGSAATGDWNKGASDFNVLCVLKQISWHELGDSEPVFRWWRDQGNPPPLLMSETEVRTSTDCFPMEFHDMKAHRRVLAGTDVIAELEIDRSFYRAQVEHELRAKLLRLRQKAAEALGRPEALAQLLSDSISTFCVLGRHALLLAGREARWAKRDVIAEMEKVLGMRFDGFNAVLNIRADGKLPKEFKAVLVFEKYLAEVDALVAFVDQIDK